MMKIVLHIVFVLLLLSSCNKEKYFDGPNNYQDDFESYQSTDDLFDGNDEQWSFSQNTRDNNEFSVSTAFAHSGSHSIRFIANPTDDDGASKCAIVKQKMAFYEGETVRVEAWYYLLGNDELQWLFLMDLEEQAAIGAGPGIRVALVDNALAIEHKIPNPNLIQDASSVVEFPRNQWVKVTLEVKLSQKKKGYVKLYQNDTLIINQDKWRTLPRDILYFQQGTKGMYTSIEFGITANSFSNNAELYLDDVKCEVL